MRCICLPRCLGGGVHEEGEGDSKKDIMNDNRPHIHRKLNQYFTNDVGSAHIPHHHQKTLTQQFTPSNPNPAKRKPTVARCSLLPRRLHTNKRQEP